MVSMCLIYGGINWLRPTWATIGFDNGLVHVRRQATIWTNSVILLIGPLSTNFSEIGLKFLHFHSRICIWNVVWNMITILSRPQYVNYGYQLQHNHCNVCLSLVARPSWKEQQHIQAETETKWPPCSRRHFQRHLLNKILNFDYNFWRLFLRL